MRSRTAMGIVINGWSAVSDSEEDVVRTGWRAEGGTDGVITGEREAIA